MTYKVSSGTLNLCSLTVDMLLLVLSMSCCCCRANVKQRSIVAREPGGCLRFATAEERDRALHVYYPRPGKMYSVPRMFHPDQLEVVVNLFFLLICVESGISHLSADVILCCRLGGGILLVAKDASGPPVGLLPLYCVANVLSYVVRAAVVSYSNLSSRCNQLE